MQFVRSYQIFGLLCYVAIVVGRQQFGTDGSGNDVAQRGAYRIARIVACNPLDKHPHQTLRNRAIDVVHRHMVAVVGRPTECSLAQIARTDDHAADRIGNIHQYLRALACLRIFVCRTALGRIDAYVAEMLFARGLD